MLSGLTVRPRAFRPARRPRPSRGLGTRIGFSLSEPAVVSLRFRRALPGRRAGARCVRVTRANRRAGRCTRYVTLRGAQAVAGRAGANRVTFDGRLRGRALAAGAYRLVAAPRDAAGNAGAARRVQIRVRRVRTR
jgi:hypothetical protein